MGSSGGFQCTESKNDPLLRRGCRKEKSDDRALPFLIRFNPTRPKENALWYRTKWQIIIINSDFFNLLVELRMQFGMGWVENQSDPYRVVKG